MIYDLILIILKVSEWTFMGVKKLSVFLTRFCVVSLPGSIRILVWCHVRICGLHTGQYTIFSSAGTTTGTATGTATGTVVGTTAGIGIATAAGNNACTVTVTETATCTGTRTISRINISTGTDTDTNTGTVSDTHTGSFAVKNVNRSF